MNIDTKTALLFLLPMLGVAVAWGESVSRLEALEQHQSKLVTLNQLETIKLEIKYISQQTKDNSEMLKQIWGIVNER